MKQLRFDQAVRNLTFSDLEIPIVVIGLRVTGLKKTGFMFLLDLFGEGRGENGWCDFVCVERLIGLILVRLMSFTNGEYGFSFKRSWYWIFNLRTKLCCIPSESEISSGLHCKNFILDI